MRPASRLRWSFALLVLALVALGAGAARTASAGTVAPAVNSFPKQAQEVSPLAGATGQVLFACQTRAENRCYGPDQIREAYGINPLLNSGVNGAGRTIVIIDAYGSPTIEQDLQTFDATWGIPDTSFQIIRPDGPPDPTDIGNFFGWGVETSLDVEWAHVVAPAANIVLVVAKSNNDADILSATKYVVEHDVGDILSQSYGEAEQCMDPGLLAQQHQYFIQMQQKGMSVFASSGDAGAAQPSCDGSSFIKAASTPASDPLVTAVGGTKLNADLVTGRYISETTWNETIALGGAAASGGGFSIIFPRPDYQNAVVRSDMRGLPDVAYNAAVDGGVLVLLHCPAAICGEEGSFWFRVGGTSAGSPQWAALAALADQFAGRRLGLLNPRLYQLGRLAQTRFFHDIADNSDNGLPADFGGPITGFHAVPGWDAATGWGSPIAWLLVPALGRS